MSNDLVKVAAKNIKRVGTFGVVLYRNQLPVNFILHSAELHIGSSIKYGNTLFGNNFLKFCIAKTNLISFNCFSEYISFPTQRSMKVI